jgi:hypothetical protein
VCDGGGLDDSIERKVEDVPPWSQDSMSNTMNGGRRTTETIAGGSKACYPVLLFEHRNHCIEHRPGLRGAVLA